ncbi:hypothetical protein [Aquimarina sp. 2201CG5-10]|uniref:hypothetical protein n=1 Tax=Aquimarina callyspongiae TaxID=3098150 RepID=UPI002AB49F5E|nr:hypothetical protein [Aquimarina sp. 2201CG5-10]MDY8136830.1 hypothetical protein [Aquimarina sp. 2201CG5-10]
MKPFKYILVVLAMITISSCKSELEIISAIKETIIPGAPTAESYVQYIIRFKNLNEEVVEINNVDLPGSNLQKEDITFGMLKMDTRESVSKIESKGEYELIIRPNQSENIISDENNKVVITYTINSIESKITINSFEKKTTRRR